MTVPGQMDAGWYHAEGDPAGTERYWDGSGWSGDYREVSAPFSMGGGPPGTLSFERMLHSNLPGLGNRLGGRVLDLLIWIIPVVIVPFVVGLSQQDAALEAFENGTTLPTNIIVSRVILSLVAMSIVVAYEAGMNMKGPGTVGKMVTGTKIVKVDGSDPSLLDHIKRLSPYIAISIVGLYGFFLPQTLGAGVAQLPVLLIQIGIVITALIMVATDDKEQALWDKIAGTVVIHKA